MSNNPIAMHVQRLIRIGFTAWLLGRIDVRDESGRGLCCQGIFLVGLLNTVG